MRGKHLRAAQQLPCAASCPPYRRRPLPPGAPLNPASDLPVEPLLLTSARISTFDGARSLTAASGFFFLRGERLFLITNRHVLLDPASEHRPNRIELSLHQRGGDLRLRNTLSLWLYEQGLAQWRQASDSGGEVDVAALEIPLDAIPAGSAWRAFEPRHLWQPGDTVRVGEALLVVGFPLGFYDTLHNLPVVRGAVLGSAFGVRFQGQGCFITDAPLHRGSSGAPVLRHRADADDDLPWQVLGVHASRLDMQTRDQQLDASLGLNLAWYADVLLTLTR